MEEIAVYRHPAPFYIKRILGALIVLALAGSFLFSAYTKIIAIRQFEWAFQDLGIEDGKLSAILARVMVGIELLIGVFLLAHLYLKKFTYPLVITFLTVMNIYLVYLIVIRHGNTGNCGCFGSTYYMTPRDAIFKNLGMTAACIIAIYIYPIRPYKHQDYLASFLAMVCIALPLVLNPLSARKTKMIDLAPLYQTDSLHMPVDLRQGKHVVAFMSLGCEHCREAAQILDGFYKKDPSLPVFLILAGRDEQEAEFFAVTGAMEIPHLRFRNAEAFTKMADRRYVPVIYWINNGEIVREVTSHELDAAEIKRWAGRN